MRSERRQLSMRALARTSLSAEDRSELVGDFLRCRGLQRHDAEGHAGDPIDIEGFHHVGDGRQIGAHAGEMITLRVRIDLQRRVFRHEGCTAL